MEGEKTRKVRVTHHFVFVLVPPGRIRGSNNVCVRVCGAIVQGRGHSEVREGERDGEKSSARGEERDLPVSPSVCAAGESRVRCVCVWERVRQQDLLDRVCLVLFFFIFGKAHAVFCVFSSSLFFIFRSPVCLVSSYIFPFIHFFTPKKLL